MSQRWRFVVLLCIILCSATYALLVNLLVFDESQEDLLEKAEGTDKVVDVVNTARSERVRFYSNVGEEDETGEQVHIGSEESEGDKETDEDNARRDAMARDEHLSSISDNAKRAEEVHGAVRHAWKAYKKFAWGMDELQPLSETGKEWFGLGLTLVDSLDLLWILEEKEEFEGATKWVERNLNPSIDADVNVFEVTIRVMGGLLSAYALSHEEVFLRKAKQLGRNLKPAFKSRSGIPFSDANLQSRTAFSPPGAPDSSLAEASSIQLEFKYLAYLTDDEDMYSLADHSMWALERARKKQGKDVGHLPPMYVNAQSGLFRESSTITIGARGDSYFEYLLKQWLLTEKVEKEFMDAYNEGIVAIKRYLVRYSEPNKLAYVGELVNGASFHPKMDHLVCYLPGTLALGYWHGLDDDIIIDTNLWLCVLVTCENRSHLTLAKELMVTCYSLYNSTATGLSPEIAHFNDGSDENQWSDIIIHPRDTHNILRPETVESLFYLHKVTGDPLYQEWGWNIFRSFEQYTRLPHAGYAGIQNVMITYSNRIDKMESFWLGETLKYFYLLFHPKDLLPLDKYVFNTEAHPIPVFIPKWLAPPKGIIPKKSAGPVPHLI